jgi:thiamine biosynthesis lipoprotein
LGGVWATCLLLAVWAQAGEKALLEIRDPSAVGLSMVRSFYLMGTRILIEAEGTEELAGKAIEAAYLELERVDQGLSTYKPDSEISRLNQELAGTGVRISPMTSEIIGEALRLAELSRGAFDPTVGPLVSLWGFDELSVRVPHPERVSATLSRVGFEHLTWDPPSRTLRSDRVGVEIDLGAIAKGFAIDRALAAMRRIGTKSGLVDLGESSIGFFGSPRSFAIRHPLEPDEMVARFELEGGAVSTSAGYERGFEQDGRWYSHIIDPRTGAPVQDSVSATVVGDEGEAMKVDALATAGFVLGPDQAVGLWQREGVEGILFFRVGETVDCVKTPGFAVVLPVEDP